MNREPIGLKSLSGLEILEGSTVAVYAQKYKVTSVHNDGEEGTARVVEIDQSKPLPVADIVLAHGHVYWSVHDLAWRCRLVWLCPEWHDRENGPSPVDIGMGGGHYAFEIIDQ